MNSTFYGNSKNNYTQQSIKIIRQLIVKQKVSSNLRGRQIFKFGLLKKKSNK
jgi:hypothetical protein